MHETDTEQTHFQSLLTEECSHNNKTDTDHICNVVQTVKDAQYAVLCAQILKWEFKRGLSVVTVQCSGVN